jgi:LysR family transcriptional regulator, regulator for bpeEF and oprC
LALRCPGRTAQAFASFGKFGSPAEEEAMDRIDVMKLFVRVADLGSFSKAGKAEGLAQPTVSKQIAALEARLDVQLLRRGSNGLSLTQAGQDYYESSMRLLGEFGSAEARIGRGQTNPSGRIRVAMSAGFGRMYIVPRLPEFFARYPDVAVDLDVSDRHVNLIEEGIDVAIRIGNLSDSSLVARRIGSIKMETFAAPEYLGRHGEPKTPQELKDHACVVFLFQGAPRIWQYKLEEGMVAIEPDGRSAPMMPSM